MGCGACAPDAKEPAATTKGPRANRGSPQKPSTPSPRPTPDKATRRPAEPAPEHVTDPRLEEAAGKPSSGNNGQSSNRQEDETKPAAPATVKQPAKYTFVPGQGKVAQLFPLSDPTEETTFRPPFSGPSGWDRIIQPFDGAGEQGFVLDLLELPTRNWYAECVSMNVELHSAEWDNGLARVHDHFRWLAWALGRFFFGTWESRRSVTESFRLPDRTSSSWKQGFVWKGVNIHLCSAPEAELYRQELAAIRRLAREDTTIISQNALLPLLALARCGTETLVVTACIFPDKDWRHDPAAFFQKFISGVRGDSKIPSRLGPDDIVVLDNDAHFISSQPRTRFVLINNSGHSRASERIPMLLYVPANSDTQVEVFPKIRAAAFDEHTLLAILDKAGRLATSRRERFFGWDLQVCSASPKGRDNERINSVLMGTAEDPIKGDAVVGGYYRRQGSDNVAEKIDETVIDIRTKAVYANVAALKRLLHQKGLSLRYEWMLLPFIRERQQRELIRFDILLRATKKVIEHKLWGTKKPDRVLEYKQTVARYLNALLRQNSVAEMGEVFQSLFFSRLRVMREAGPVPGVVLGTGRSLSYLFSDKIIQSVFQSARHDPALFLASAESVLGITFRREETLREAREDKFAFLKGSAPLDSKSITDTILRVDGPGWAEDHSCSELERLVNNKLGAGKAPTDKKERSTRELYMFAPSAQAEPNDERKTPAKIRLVDPHKEDNSGNIHELFLLRDIFPSETRPASQVLLEAATSSQGRLALEKWVDYNETLFSGLRSLRGDEYLLIYSKLVSHLPHLAFPESTHLSPILELIESLKTLNACPPELVLFSLTMSGVSAGCMGMQSESECFLTYSLWVFLLLYGDPRGRGNSSHPWGLLLAYLLRRVAELGKRTMDADYMDELFACIKHGLGEQEAVVVSPEDVKISLGDEDDSNSNNVQRSAQHGAESDSGTRHVLSIFGKNLPPLVLPNGSLSTALIHWILAYNPVASMSGVMWRHEDIVAAFDAKLGELYPRLESMSRSQFVGATPGKERRQLLAQGNSFCQLFTKDSGAVARSETRGAVFVWGSDQYGQLGLADGEELPSENKRLVCPRFCYTLKDVIIRDVACGRNNSFAIDINNAVYAWGANEYGQLGLGHTAPKNVASPIAIHGLPSDLSVITAGIEHTAAYCLSGEVFTWGNGESGLLGHGDGKSYDTPKKVAALADKGVKMVVCGGLHTIALTNDGRVFAWGRAEGGQLGLGERDLEELMRSQGDCYVSVPRWIDTGPLKTKHMDSVACGEAHTLALDNEGAVYGWGFSNYGQLGLGRTSDCYEPGTGDFNSKVNVPTKVEALAGVKIVRLTAGSTFSLFVSDSGEVYGCGVNDFGQTGTEVCQRDLEIFYPSAKKFVQTTDVPYPVHIACFAKIGVNAIASGENHSLAFSTDPCTLWTWGKNDQGQLGLGETGKVLGPRVIPSFCSVPVSKVACGANHSLVIVGDGVAAAAGSPVSFNKEGDEEFHSIAAAKENRWEVSVKLSEDLNPPRRVSLLEDEASIAKPNS